MAWEKYKGDKRHKTLNCARLSKDGKHLLLALKAAQEFNMGDTISIHYDKDKNLLGIQKDPDGVHKTIRSGSSLSISALGVISFYSLDIKHGVLYPMRQEADMWIIDLNVIDEKGGN